ncbi:MAG: leucine-rich repeat domain-containing protein [Muribaculaceae bacterium]|nr:leucine-rich repeat domain-containing protein [Muribaculaceae bacterium]
MDKKILFLFLMGFIVMAASAATKYEINIAGVEVTSDNANYITGGDMRGGHGVYNASTNTLMLYNIYIYRNGQDNYGIHNRKCDNLTIVFNGNCTILAADNALKLERSTTLTSAAGSKTEFYSSSRICANLKSYTYHIKGSGIFEFSTGQSGYEAIKGDGSGSTNVYFEGGKVYASSLSRSALSSFSAKFYSENHLEISSNGSDASVSDVTMQFFLSEAVISPYQATYNSSAKSVCVGSTPIIDKTIIISDDYVAILNSSYFPDQNFRTKLYNSYFSKGYINSSDVASTTALNVSGCNISNLTGIGYFTNLRNLNCSNNNLPSLPTLPGGLTSLFCNNNQLTALPTLPSTIQTLYAGSNKFNGTLSITGKSSLSTLDVSNNTLITTLNCSGNALTSLSYYGCTALKTLNCSSNNLSSLPTLPSGLTTLYCNNNQLTSLTNLPMSLQSLYCGSNKFSGTFSLTSRSNLKTLDVSSNSYITTLNCYSNSLTTLNVSGCSALTTLDCGFNQLTSLDVSSLSNLTVLQCYYNKLTSLNVANKTKLTNVEAVNNQLTSLNVSGCTALQRLVCGQNKLSSLSVEGCNALRELNCYGNQIKESGMNTLVNSLCTIPAGSSGDFLVLYPGLSSEGYTEGNVITNAQVSIARNKRWMPKKWNGDNWVEIPAGAVPGDVNGDGHVSSVDVTALYNYLLDNNGSDIVNGDQDGDGHISSVDITVVYNILLGQ